MSEAQTADVRLANVVAKAIIDDQAEIYPNGVGENSWLIAHRHAEIAVQALCRHLNLTPDSLERHAGPRG